jgi:Arc/MetJ-type ribon-helix-helix transcriptional regulator
MNVNVSLDGYTQEIVNEAIKRGIVKTKAEAIRFALLLFGKEYRLEDVSLEEVLKVNKKIKEEMKEIKEGKVKLVPWGKVKAEAGI